MSSTLQVQGNVDGVQGPLGIQLPQQQYGAPIGSVIKVALASGANTITVPAGTTSIIIQPPVGNTVLMTLKGVTGDTGVFLHKTLATGPINVDSTLATFCLTAASAIATQTTITFI